MTPMHDTASNFQWPMAGRLFPVILHLERDPRCQQLDLDAWCRDEEDGFLEPFGRISVIPTDGSQAHFCSAPDEFYIRNYSENEGILQALIEQGYVTDTGARVRGGFVEFPRVKLTAKGKALAPGLFPD